MQPRETPSNKLPRQYLVVAVVVCVAMVLLGFLIFQSAARTTTARSEVEVSGSARQLANILNREIAMNIRSLESLSQMLGTATNIDDALAEQSKVLKQFKHIFILNRGGKITNISPYKYDLIGMNLADTAFFQGVIAHKAAYISDPGATAFGYLGITVAVPIFVDVGQHKWDFYGIIGATTNTDEFFRVLDDPSSVGIAMVLDAQGHIIHDSSRQSHFLQDLSDRDQTSASLKLFQSMIRGKSATAKRYFENGKEFIGAFTTFGPRQWTVLAAVSVVEVLQDINELMKRAAYFTVLFVFIALSVIMFVKMRIENLQAKVVERTRKIYKILSTIDQGIVTFGADLKIDPEYSGFMQRFKRTKSLAGDDVLQVVFGNSNIDGVTLAKLRQLLVSVVGQSSGHWDRVYDQLPCEAEVKIEGKEMLVGLKWAPLLDGTDRIERILLSIIDLTPFRNLQAKLITTAKLSSLGEMAGGIAHEINSPLAVILMRCDQIAHVLKSDKPDMGQVFEMLAAIEVTGLKVKEIVTGLQFFSRNADQDSFTQTSVKRIVDETLVLCAEKFAYHGIELKVNGLTDDTKLQCRPVQIGQVILNLLNNSFHAVHLSHEGDTKWVTIACSHDSSTLQIAVVDSGPGIPHELQNKIMEPFFTTKEVGQGTGLGLSISKGIAESHGGTLVLDPSSANTRFVLTLPMFQTARR